MYIHEVYCPYSIDIIINKDVIYKCRPLHLLEDFMLSVCCFIGHRNIIINSELEYKLKQCVIHLIVCNGVNTFLFGSKSEFNDLALNVLIEIKKEYPNIMLIYVRAEYPIISNTYLQYLLASYDDTFFPDCLENAGKAIYVERNKWMIDESEYCIFYYNPYYVPKKKNNKNPLQYRNSGTKLMYEYAKMKNKKIYNLYE